jgi:hypothetical protein
VRARRSAAFCHAIIATPPPEQRRLLRFFMPSDFPLMSWRRRHAAVIFRRHATLRRHARCRAPLTLPPRGAAIADAMMPCFRCRLRCHAATPLFFADAIIAAFMTAMPLIFAITPMLRHASRQPPLRHFAASFAYFTPPRQLIFRA